MAGEANNSIRCGSRAGWRKVSHISTHDGASLEFFETANIPGITVLQD